MTPLANQYQRLRHSIVGFVPRFGANGRPIVESCGKAPPPIFGTGFVVSEDGLVVTNRHVVDQFDVIAGSRDMPAHLAVMAMFLRPHGDGVRMTLVPVCETLSVRQVQSGDKSLPGPDIALVQLYGKGFVPASLASFRDPLFVGDEIATMGWCGGSSPLVFRGERLNAPILQRGIVSAIFWLKPGLPSVFYIDVMVQPGASGSPVFHTASGKVVGAISHRVLDPSPTRDEPRPTSLSTVVATQWIDLTIQAMVQTNQLKPWPDAPPVFDDQLKAEELNRIVDEFFRSAVAEYRSRVSRD